MMKLAENFYGVSGSPADCIHVGIPQVLKNKKPDLIISGINRGANLGQDVFYSGTVSAAREGCIMGIPSIAVSLAVDFNAHQAEEKLHYSSAAQYTVKLIKYLQKKSKKKKIKMPDHVLYNLNVPNLPMKQIKGLSLSRQGVVHYSGRVVRRVDHRGKDYFWVGGDYLGYQKVLGTDSHTVHSLKYASLTPLKLDCTAHEVLLDMVEDMNNEIILKV
jgi:5'-nucleotidase